MGAPSSFPEQVCAAILAAAGLSLVLAPASGCNLFSGPEQPPGDIVPHACVFCIPYDGGSAPMPFFAGQAQDLRYLSVQVLVRGDVDAYDTARALTWNCMQALTRKNQPSTGYIDALLSNSQPIYLGNDATDHPRFAFNVKLRFQG